MAQQEVVRLFRSVLVDSELRESLNNAPSLESLIEMAQNFGYQFTLEEWQQATGFAVEEFKCELSEIPGI